MSLTWDTWALLGTSALAALLCIYALIDVRDIPAERYPKHARWTTQGSTQPLHPRGLPRPAPMELDGGEVQPLQVRFCTWCPDPENPSPIYHPLGVPAHREN